MTPDTPRPSARRAALLDARRSRRPSRLGRQAGVTPVPDRTLREQDGFPGLLARAWQAAADAPDLSSAVQVLLTLDGHVPAHVQLRSLRIADECALTVLAGTGGRPGGRRPGEPVRLGALGLARDGRIVVAVPPDCLVPERDELVADALQVPWTEAALADHRRELAAATARFEASVRDCREWLGRAGAAGRDALVDELGEAALRTAPFVLHHEGRRYTNFRERNNLPGKTLWPGHPDNALTALRGLPLERWSDPDAVVVVSLMLLVRSGGFGRIEEANGTQLTLERVAGLLERIRLGYNGVPHGTPVPPAASTRVDALLALAEALRARRAEIVPHAQLYREIHGPLMHKIERVAGPYGPASRRREAEVCARLARRLPVRGDSLAALGDAVADAPDWLARRHGAFGTGLESLVHETVAAAAETFRADFAMSRGLRSLPRLIAMLRAEDWSEICGWELPEYFCCVLATPRAFQHFDDSPDRVADTAWAMSARMQYNSWHFLPGNLPKVADVADRDHFVPPTMPDISFFSDQHHRGHVAAKVRFSIRSPQSVEVLGRRLGGFVDLRLLRCAGPPFAEEDVLAAHRVSAFVARATGSAAGLVAAGADIEVTAFDSRWHWEAVTRPGNRWQAYGEDEEAAPAVPPVRDHDGAVIGR